MKEKSRNWVIANLNDGHENVKIKVFVTGINYFLDARPLHNLTIDIYSLKFFMSSSMLTAWETIVFSKQRLLETKTYLSCSREKVF